MPPAWLWCPWALLGLHRVTRALLQLVTVGTGDLTAATPATVAQTTGAVMLPAACVCVRLATWAHSASSVSSGLAHSHVPCVHTCAHTQVRAHTHTGAYTQVHAHTGARTHTGAHTQVHTGACTCTHTHMQALGDLGLPSCPPDKQRVSSPELTALSLPSLGRGPSLLHTWADVRPTWSTGQGEVGLAAPPRAPGT